MRPTLLFRHGWAFDAGLWDAVVARLGGFRCLVEDRGYFGAANEPVVDGPHVVVGHSQGAMRAPAETSGACLGLVAINGFDCFAARDGFPGVPLRVIDRMIARLGASAADVVAQFRQRCGAEPGGAPIGIGRLAADLARLRDGDGRVACAAADIPILSLQGGADPILPPAMRAAVFAGARQVERHERAGADHLLPLRDPAYCAAMIAGFAEIVA